MSVTHDFTNTPFVQYDIKLNYILTVATVVGTRLSRHLWWSVEELRSGESGVRRSVLR
jgi:hypothetical protein